MHQKNNGKLMFQDVLLERSPALALTGLAVLIAAFVFFHWKRSQPASGLLRPFEAEINFASGTDPEEARRDFDRSFFADGILVEQSARIVSLRTLLSKSEDLAELLGRWFPNSDSEALACATLQFFSVGGVFDALLQTPFPPSLHQPLRLIRAEPGIFLKLCVLGFVGQPADECAPDERYSPWGARVESGNVTLEIGEVVAKIKVFPAKRKKKSLELLADYGLLCSFIFNP